MPVSETEKAALLAAVTAASATAYAGTVTTIKAGGCSVIVIPPPATVVVPLPAPPPVPPALRLMGWELNATNCGLSGVGVNKLTLPLFTGSIVPGMTITGKKFTGPVNLANRPGVTLDRCWIAPTGGDIAVVLGRDTIVRNSDIDCHAMNRGQERYGFAGPRGIGTQGAYTIERVNLRGATVGMELDSESAASIGNVWETWVHDMVSTDGGHLDALTRRAGDGALNLRGCCFNVDFPPTSGGTWATGAIFLQATWGGVVGGVTIADCLIAGNGYGLLMESNCRIVAATNNRFRPTEYGPADNRGGTISSWTKNYLYDPAQLNAAGALVPVP